MGAYFRSEGADWRWSRQVELLVREKMALRNVSEPTRVIHKCLKSGLVCEKHEIRWEATGLAAGGQEVGTEGDERKTHMT